MVFGPARTLGKEDFDVTIGFISTSVLAWLTLGFAADPTVVPGETMVTVAQVEVRGGPSEECYLTSLVKHGDRLTALHAVPLGWIAIKPPPGSFSWVEAKAIKRAADGKTGMVVVDRAPVWIGSSFHAKQPDLSQGTLKRGQMVEIIGGERMAKVGELVPILPPAFEVRYVPASAVGEPVDGKEMTDSAKGASAQQGELAELRARVQHLERRLAELDKQMLQGEWVLVAVDGNEVEIPEGRKLVLKGDKWTAPTGHEFKLKLDPSKSPKELTLMNDKERYPGIYKVEGDTFSFCRTEALGGERPKEFKGDSSLGVHVLVFKRAEKK
jgi:uncharacterized protein (TIGR03067 family)